MKYVCCAALLFGLFGAGAAAQDFSSKTGADLLAQCQLVGRPDLNTLEMMSSLQCVSYLRGMANTLVIWKAFSDARNKANPPQACAPDGVIPQELAMVVVKFLNDHPTKLHDEYGIVAFSALVDAYPCK
jgi:hypothetical protein